MRFWHIVMRAWLQTRSALTGRQLTRAEKKKKIDRELNRRNSELGEWLRNARVSARLTQTTVARMMGRDQTYIAKIEHGIRRITFAEAEMMAEICRTSITVV